MEPRSIFKAVVYTFLTCGIYGCYWFVRLTDEAHFAVGRQTTASGVKALIYTLITCGIYSFYWMFKMGETLTEAKRQRGLPADGNDGIIYLLFAFCGLAIVSEALIQSSLNDIFDFDARNAAVTRSFPPPTGPFA